MIITCLPKTEKKSFVANNLFSDFAVLFLIWLFSCSCSWCPTIMVITQLVVITKLGSFASFYRKCWSNLPTCILHTKSTVQCFYQGQAEQYFKLGATCYSPLCFDLSDAVFVCLMLSYVCMHAANGSFTMFIIIPFV